LRRRLLNLLTALSLLLCVAAVALWVRSYIRHDVMRYYTAGGNRCGFIASRGTLVFDHQSNVIYYGGKVPSKWEVNSRPTDDLRTMAWRSPWTERRLFGYGVVINRGVVGQGQQSARPGEWRSFVLILPYWLILVAFGVLPTVFVIRRARSTRRRKNGLCPRCGYDLRATPGRCPECGAKQRVIVSTDTVRP
jgi:hypothetical protein